MALVPRRPADGLIEQQGDHAAVDDALPALVAERHLELSGRRIPLGPKGELEALLVEGPAAEAVSVELDLHSGPVNYLDSAVWL